MHDHAPILDGRVTRHLREKIVPAEVSIVAQLEVAVAPLTDAPDSTAIGAVPGVVGQGEPVPPSVGLALDYEPFQVGAPWGPAWGTTWMRFRGTIPESHRGQQLEALIDLGGEYDSPGFQCEGLVYRADGSIIKGHNPRNQWVPVEPDADGRFEFFLEAAANPVVLGVPAFIETELGEKPTSGPAPIYTLRRADLVLVHQEVRELSADITTLRQLADQLPEDSERRWEIRRALDRALDRIALFDVPATAAAARAELADVLARPAAASAHTLTAVGHAHIDSAWLWPLRETRRKVARTVANQLNLLELHPEHKFAFPAAQHAAWLEEDHPELFERLRKAVADGGVIPVGGMWVESDANLPGGEAMCRQLLYGRAYYRDKFGVTCPEVWLPDSFGYSGALPQLAKLAGAQWFLTQKISWNQVDAFPHHSFWWEGIDGTRIFTHFPPADTYGSDLNGGNLSHAAKNFRDKGRSATSLVPFGYGDGGGGPTREMLMQAARTKDLEGSPRVHIEPPAEFFARAEAEHESPSVWVGELYLEAHRGTFTSVAAVKAGNRRSEHLLREAELWCATAAARGLMEYPLERFGDIWREVCLYQFHDILPGTCIAWVYDEVREGFARISDELTALIDEAQRLLVGTGDQAVTFNASPLVRDGVAALGAGVTETAGSVVTAEGLAVDNGLVRLSVDEKGLVTSLVDLASGRDVIPTGVVGNLLQMHPDFPNMWDAWDIDPFAFNTVTNLTDGAPELVEADGGVSVVVRRAFGDSSATQTLTLLPGDPRLHVRVDVDWKERDSLLKLAWPVDVHTDHAAFEIEMGHLVRPTHTNTSWDAHRFEVNAHRWVHVSEPGFGVAIANSQTYGWDVTRHAREAGGTYSLVRASLLKGARYPDPRTDVGEHSFSFTVHPGAGIEEAVADGYAANLSPRTVSGNPVAPLIDIDGPVAVEGVKLAEDGSGDVIVRLYEPYGRRATATLTAGFAATSAVETDLLETELVAGTPGQQVAPTAVTTALSDGTVGITLRPFQVATIRWER
ncbi:alpha-mannosidase [Tessaracoccus caeni]|uniref:alpha-mannosidase n=1 Tax=Tessaracoccus caeni TaxID=3031239 RepID=UPI0023DA40DF|nr:glycoside hydrolase family 38 C-terminal domain-containing protein [Tessaracoccus caeni]MDF1488862.1 glycoside hydrolase family 38 C-terminal domain-containing protein [Tessaracoccus caeni]